MTVRKPAVAGMFYPADPVVLAREVDQWLSPADGVGTKPPAVIVPHAGYLYSGPTAGLAYSKFVGASRPEKVVLVGPTHRVPVRAVAYPTATAFRTPLGDLPVWPGTKAALADVLWAQPNDATHAQEHALEVQLPFLQRLWPDDPVPIVPLNAGAVTAGQVADVIDALWNNETLIVISSDLSHYLPYSTAIAVDDVSIRQILTLDGYLGHEQACGATPVNGMIDLARRHRWRPTLLGACNSGDTAGDKAQVVGYCAIEFESLPPREPGLDTGQTRALLRRGDRVAP